MPVLFRQYFKEIADAETRSARIFEGHPSGLPPGEYGFIELYCNEKNCDCRRVHLMIAAEWSKEPIGMVAYGWETPAYYAKWMHSADNQMAAEMAGIMLEPFFDQSQYAFAAKKLCEEVLLTDPSYVERLKRHYRMMRDHTDGRQRSVQRYEKKQKSAKKKHHEMILPKERIPIPELASTDTIRQALLSPHEAVRNSASFFFSGCRTDDLSADIMKTVIQSVELYGIIASLGVLEALEVPQDETTLRWLMQELSKNHDLEDIRLDNYCYFLTEILCKSDPKFLTPELADLPCFSKECTSWLFKCIELAQADFETLWQMLLVSRLDDGYCSDPHFDIDDLLVEAVSRYDACNQRVLDWLQRKDVPLDDADFEDFIPVLFQIVAKKRITEAKEFVLDEILKSDEFFLTEGAEEAFASIADEDDWEMLYSRWKELPKRNQWFFGLLTEKPSQKRLEIALDMLRIIGKDKISNDRLISFLLENYVKESHTTIAEMLDDDQTVSQDEWEEHAVGLVVSGIINPDSLDDFNRWLYIAEENEWNLSDLQTQHAEERLRVTYSEVFDFGDDDDFDDEYYDDDDMGDGNERERRSPLPSFSRTRQGSAIWQSMMSDFEDDSDDDIDPTQPYHNTEPHIGRNDPCPCGSGKKYKKCCMEK